MVIGAAENDEGIRSAVAYGHRQPSRICEGSGNGAKHVQRLRFCWHDQPGLGRQRGIVAAAKVRSSTKAGVKAAARGSAKKPAANKGSSSNRSSDEDTGFGFGL